MSEPRRPDGISVIVFAFNESENTRPILAELCDYLAGGSTPFEIVFVDDGSTDDTTQVALDALSTFDSKVVRHERNRGIGAAIKTGVRHASYPWVTFFPADGQIEPRAIDTLLATQRRDNADVVFSVYANRDDGLGRKVTSIGVRALILGVHGVRLQSDGPYLFRRSIFLPEQLPSDSFFLNFEFPIRVLRAGLRVSTVTIACRPRRSGVSKSTGLRRMAQVAADLVALRIRTLKR